MNASNDSSPRAGVRPDPELRLDLPSVTRTKYWHSLDDGRVQCDLCPRFCKLHDGQRGFCFVRGCVEGQIVLTTYGRSSGYCVDPIEKKPLNHFFPGTPVLSFGTAGCNLGCKFCQNWDISKSREFDTLADEASPDVIARAAARLGCRSVAFTYNDPVIFHEYAIDVADACRGYGVQSVAVTAGEVCPEPRAEFYQFMDAANVDLKAFTERFYREICAAHLDPVLETLKYLKHHTQCLVRVDDAADTGRERLRSGARCDDQVGNRSFGTRRADALHGLSSRLSHAGQSRRRRRQRCGAPERSRWTTACGTRTRATFMIRKGKAPTVTFATSC